MKIGTDTETCMTVYVKENDRYKGCLILGSTGGGKTEGLLNILQGDSYTPCAKIIIDPSGFFAKQVYSVLRGQADYCSLETPYGINPMVSPYKPHQIADIIAETVNQMVQLTTPNERFTVKMRQILDAEIVRCIELGRTTLEDVQANLEAQRGSAETRDGIIARLNLLTSDPDFKQIICGKGFEINNLIEKQKTLIVDCSGMGYAKQVFMGTLITNLVKAYFIYSKPKEYKPLVFLIDEAHNFVSNEFTIITKQARKYKIATILSTTDFSMMPKPLVHSILSNAGTLICLKAGYIEAQMIANEFINFNKEDIQGLEKYHALYKTPEGEGIIKLPRPVFTKEIPIKIMKKETRTFDLKWFNLPSYCFQLDYDQDEAVAGNGLYKKPETPPNSTERGYAKC
jgi:type IV secretory pathway VirB4 component